MVRSRFQLRHAAQEDEQDRSQGDTAGPGCGRILEEQRRWVDRSQIWVFPAYRGEGHFDGLNKEWHRIRKLAGIEDVRIHDLRHTFASVGAGGGVGLPLIGGILGIARLRQRSDTLTWRTGLCARRPI